MGKYAVVRNDMVQNIIVLNEEQIEEFENTLNCILVDAVPYGLCIGDLKVGDNWTRNLNGVQTILEELTPQQQTDYTSLVLELSSNKKAVEQAESSLTDGVESIVDESPSQSEGQQAIHILSDAENSLREGVESVG